MSLQTTVTLLCPIADGKATIAAVEIQRPNVGALRGLHLAQLQLQDVNALCKLLPRITKPALSPEQIEQLDPTDFAAMANMVSLFFMTPTQLAAVQAAT